MRAWEHENMQHTVFVLNLYRQRSFLSHEPPFLSSNCLGYYFAHTDTHAPKPHTWNPLLESNCDPQNTYNTYYTNYT
jgi:hypothetical protein